MGSLEIGVPHVVSTRVITDIVLPLREEGGEVVVRRLGKIDGYPYEATLSGPFSRMKETPHTFGVDTSVGPLTVVKRATAKDLIHVIRGVGSDRYKDAWLEGPNCREEVKVMLDKVRAELLDTVDRDAAEYSPFIEGKKFGIQQLERGCPQDDKVITGVFPAAGYPLHRRVCFVSVPGLKSNPFGGENKPTISGEHFSFRYGDGRWVLDLQGRIEPPEERKRDKDKPRFEVPFSTILRYYCYNGRGGVSFWKNPVYTWEGGRIE